MTRTTSHRLGAALVAAAGLALSPVAGATAAPAVAPSPVAATAGAPSATRGAGPALPVYFVDDDRSGRAQPLRLFREYVPARTGLTSRQRAETAANVVMREAGLRGHRNLWGSRVVTDVQDRGSHLQVTLSGPTRRVDAAQARIATSSVVWTVTAVLGRDVPVRFVSADRQVLGGLPTAASYRRSTGTTRLRELAAVWADAPGTVRAGRRAVASGTACAHEGTVAYAVSSARGTVRRGVTTASIACPTRGSWRVDLGVLPRGTYRLQAWAPSPSGRERHLGMVTRTFSVR